MYLLNVKVNPPIDWVGWESERAAALTQKELVVKKAQILLFLLTRFHHPIQGGLPPLPG